MADTDKTYEILNYYGLKTNIEDTKKWIKQYVADALTGITTDLMTNVTYNELVSLRDNNKLKPGMLYRMTDYVTKVYSEDGSVSSAEHPFDLILTTINENTLDENGRVALHNGDEYFNECNVEACEVKYCLDNDTTRFKFASIRKEIIYSGIQALYEGSWDTGYLYKRYPDGDDGAVAWARVNNTYNVDINDTNVNWSDIDEDDLIYTGSDTPEIGTWDDEGLHEISQYKENVQTIITGENGKGVIYYMKDEFNNEAPFDFKNILQKDGEYTFGNNGEDYSLNGYANGIYNNKILPCVNSETGKQTINKIRVTGKDCHTNIFKPTCVNSYIDFPISECDISMNDDGELVIFKTQDFVSGIENHEIPKDMRKEYLTFEAVNDNTEIIFKTYTDDPQYTKTIEASKDKKNWESKTSSSEGVMLASLNAGEKLYLRGNNSSYSYYDDNADEYLPNFILPLNDCYVYGNVMSLIDSNNFKTLAEITDDYALYSLFYDYRNGDYSGEYILSHPDKKLVLPATTLANGCYSNMFVGCTSLTTAPELPATTLADFCYSGMFSNCTSLTTAPSILPATTLAGSCYSGMFQGCTGLTSAPELPATTLANYCYSYMFVGCTSLTTAPALPATTLANNCYSGMFEGCSSLNYTKCFAINGINTNNSTTNWVYGVASTGTFVKHPNATSWTTGNNGIPTNWIVEDAVIE